MEILAYIWLIGMFFLPIILLLENLLISKLSDNNIFKKWWRRNIIDNAPQDMDI